MKKLNIDELQKERISVEEFKEATKMPLIVVLDNVRSLHNVGSVFRTSDAFLVQSIYLCGISILNPEESDELHKTALGAECTVDWKYYKDTLQAIKNLQADGYIIYAIEQVKDSVKLQSLHLDASNKKYAVVFGHEVKGVQQQVVDVCQGCIEIPQFGTKHSLNVSVTAGIVIWEFANQLKLKKSIK